MPMYGNSPPRQKSNLSIFVYDTKESLFFLADCNAAPSCWLVGGGSQRGGLLSVESEARRLEVAKLGKVFFIHVF